MTTKTMVTRGTTRPKFGQKPLYKDMGPSARDDLTKQSTIPEYLRGEKSVGITVYMLANARGETYSFPVPSGFSGWPITRDFTTSKGLLAT